MNSTARHSLLAFGLVFSLAACGPKLQNVADSQGSRQAEPEAKRRETVSVGVSVSQLGAGFQLASATSFSMSLTGCASGLSLPTITQANPNVSVYKFDQGCLIKLDSFVLNGITYTPSASGGFSSWTVGSSATFEEAAHPSNNFKVVVGAQLNSPITGQEAVSYSFTQLASGTDETIAKTVIGDSHALSVSGQDAPAMDVKGVTMTGMSAGGAGQFVFKVECDTAVTGTSPNTICGTTQITAMSYKLVKDTYSGVLTAAQAAAIFDGSETAIVAGDLIAAGSPSAANGGFNTQSISGPAQIHANPNMLFIIKAGASFKYFNVDVTTLTYP